MRGKLTFGIVLTPLLVSLLVNSCVGVWTWKTWYEPFDDNSNGWALSSGASITGSVLDCSSTYATGENSLGFLSGLDVDAMTIDFDANRGSSSSAIVGVTLYYLDYRVHIEWNYYGPHSVLGFGYQNATGFTAVSYPEESGWRHIRIVLEDLTAASPRASYYFENEGVLKTVAEDQSLYYSPNPTKISMVNGYTSTVQYDDLTIDYYVNTPGPPLVPEFPLGLAFQILFIPVIIYMFWRNRQTRNS